MLESSVIARFFERFGGSPRINRHQALRSSTNADWAVRGKILTQLLQRLTNASGKEMVVSMADHSESGPDVVVTISNETALFKTRSRKASEWLHHHCRSVSEHVMGDTEFYIHPIRSKEILDGMTKAGFAVQFSPCGPEEFP